MRHGTQNGFSCHPKTCLHVNALCALQHMSLVLLLQGLIAGLGQHNTRDQANTTVQMVRLYLMTDKLYMSCRLCSTLLCMVLICP